MALLAFPARTTMFSKCFASDRRPSVLIWSSNCWFGGEGASPSLPPATCWFCSAIAACTCAAVTPSWARRSGLSQTRMA